MLKIFMLVFSLVFATATLPVKAQQQSYVSFVETHQVVTQYVRGELRFCQVELVAGYICRQQVNFFGKTKLIAGDWWHVENYVTAASGIQNPEIISVEPNGRGGLLIKFTGNR